MSLESPFDFISKASRKCRNRTMFFYMEKEMHKGFIKLIAKHIQGVRTAFQIGYINHEKCWIR